MMQRSISMAALELATTRHYGTMYIHTNTYTYQRCSPPICVARCCVRCRLFSLYAKRDVGSRAILYPGQGPKNCHKLNSIRVAFFGLSFWSCSPLLSQWICIPNWRWNCCCWWGETGDGERGKRELQMAWTFVIRVKRTRGSNWFD